MTPRVGQPIWISDVNTELGRAASAAFSFNDAEAVLLSGNASLPSPALSNWWSAMKTGLTVGADFLNSRAGYRQGSYGNLSPAVANSATINQLSAPLNGGGTGMSIPILLGFTTGSTNIPIPLAMTLSSGGNQVWFNPTQVDPFTYLLNSSTGFQPLIGGGYTIYLKFQT